MVDPARRQFDFMNEQIKEAQATAALWKRAAKKWHRQTLGWQSGCQSAQATADRRLELLVTAEQTLRNLANGELEGDAKQIASNAAARIRKELADNEEV